MTFGEQERAGRVNFKEVLAAAKYEASRKEREVYIAQLYFFYKWLKQVRKRKNWTPRQCNELDAQIAQTKWELRKVYDPEATFKMLLSDVEILGK